MMRIATQISTGLIIEMQSDAVEGTLIENAVSSGIRADDVLEEVLTPLEYHARMLIQEPPATPKKQLTQEAIIALLKKAGVSDADIEAAQT